MIPGSPPPHLYRGPSVLARFIFFALLSLLLLFLDTRYQHLKWLRAGIATSLYPLQQLVLWPKTAAQNVGVYFSNKAEQEEHINDLQQALLDHSLLAQETQTVLQENAQIKELLELKARTPRDTHAAEMLFDTRDPFVQKITIDKGHMHGLKEGSAVIDLYGIVGQITHVSPFTSEVTLLIEKNHTTPVQVERTGMRSVLYGMGAGVPMELRFVSPAADVKIGDRLVTSGLENVYPPGLAVATVTAIAISSDSEQSFAHITATPMGGVINSRYFLVIDALAPASADPPSPAPTERNKNKPAGNRRGS